MKLVTYQVGKKDRLGVVQGDWVVDIGLAIGLIAKRRVPRRLSGQSSLKDAANAVLAAGPAPRDMIALLERGESWQQALGVVIAALAETHTVRRAGAPGGVAPSAVPKGLVNPLSSVRLRAPILRPGKIVCVGRNYAEHALERGAEIPTQPIFFLKSANTICGPGDPVVLPPNSAQVDYEAEFAVVIGKGGKRIPEENAYEHIAGYTILNDVSARDMQRDDKQWFRGKSCDTFAPTGPWIATRDDIPDPHGLRIALTLNGQTMQDSHTRYMIFKIPYLVSYLSQSLTWEAGDLISTGTPEGVGAHRTPPVFLKPGDTVSITVERLGTLTNPIGGQ
jgi:2-keto-4-pentenoate hydratase/2-oxohepta-3-ene-1,7-dioic acid hydratase in catechol pathway